MAIPPFGVVLILMGLAAATFPVIVGVVWSMHHERHEAHRSEIQLLRSENLRLAGDLETVKEEASLGQLRLPA